MISLYYAEFAGKIAALVSTEVGIGVRFGSNFFYA